MQCSFFWAAHRLAALHAREQLGFIIMVSDPDALSLRTCRPVVILLFHFEGMLERGFRVRVARRRGKAEAFVFCFSRGPCIP